MHDVLWEHYVASDVFAHHFWAEYQGWKFGKCA